MENFDITGRWRERYENGRDIDMSGKLMKRYPFANVVEFKQAIVSEKKRFAKAFTEHLMRFALERKLSPRDRLSIEKIVADTASSDHSMQSILRALVASEPFKNRK